MTAAAQLVLDFTPRVRVVVHFESIRGRDRKTGEPYRWHWVIGPSDDARAMAERSCAKWAQTGHDATYRIEAAQ